MSVHRSTTSVRDVAALAGVSVGTVSNVLNSPQLVSEATRQRVQDAIVKLGWVRNESARQLGAGLSRSIGLVVMDIANPFFTDLTAGVENYVYERGYTVQLGNSAQDPQRETTHLELFEQQRVRGLLFAPIAEVGDRLFGIRGRGMPVVVVDRAGDDLNFCSVSVNDVEGGRLAVAHLAALGHRNIAFVGGPSNLRQVRDRKLGAELARTSAAGQIELLVISTPLLDVASGLAAAGEIAALADVERPTGVFAANDLLAMGLLQGCVTYGLRVPEDVAIIGYDDITFAGAAAVPLSSIRQPRHNLGHQAAELLFEEIRAADEGRDHEHQQIRFTPELVVRRSTSGRAGSARG